MKYLLAFIPPDALPRIKEAIIGLSGLSRFL
jgi:hypothetical protein